MKQASDFNYEILQTDYMMNIIIYQYSYVVLGDLFLLFYALYFELYGLLASKYRGCMK